MGYFSIEQHKPFYFINLILLIAGLLPMSIQAAPDNGRIAGSIVEIGTQAPLSGVQVQISESNLNAATNRQGNYLFNNVPPGNYELIVSYIGYESVVQTDIQIESGETTIIDFELRSAVLEAKAVVVSAEQFAQSEATAMNMQRNAPNITSVVASDLMGTFPDPNAVEAMSRVSGISITRDMGEGRFAIVRGLAPRYGSTTIFGERIPSAEEEVRFIALDIIPADLIESIVVNKALTADMDADAIGGTVNLNIKEAPDRQIFHVVTGYGMNEHPGRDMGYNNSQAVQRLSLTAGNTLADGKLNYIIVASYYKNFISTDNREYGFDFENPDYQNRPGIADGIENQQKREYELYRTRKGLTWSVFYKPVLGHKFYIQNLWTSFDDSEYRWRVKTDYKKEKTVRQTRDRAESQILKNITAGGDHQFGSGSALDYHLTYSDHIGTRLKDLEIDFAQPFSENDRAFYFVEANEDYWKTKDYNYIAAVNYQHPYIFEQFQNTLQLGFKLRNKNRSVKKDKWEATPAENSELWTLGGGANTNQFPDEKFQPPVNVIFEDASKAWNNYSAKEQISAGYVQIEILRGSRWMFLPGVRVERTSLDYSSDYGFPATNSYWNVFPGLHFRYHLLENMNIKLAGTRAINRPAHYELAPYDYTKDDKRYMGNPRLEPATSTNLELQVEHFNSQSAGIMSAGVFYKSIENAVELINWKSYGTTHYQPKNTSSATLYGVELSLRQQLNFIGLKNFSFVTNFIISESKVNLEMRSSRSLSGHSRYVASSALRYENPGLGFSGMVAVNYKSRQLDAAGKAEEDDAYETDYSRLDCKFSQRIISGVRLTIEGHNLLDSPLHYVVKNLAKDDVTLQEEYYGRSIMGGLNINF